MSGTIYRRLLSVLVAPLAGYPSMAGPDSLRPDLLGAAPSCPERVPYRLVGSRELTQLTENVSQSIKDAHTALEEWGTLSMSGLLLAPPIKAGGGPKVTDKQGTFGVDINGTHVGDPGSEFNFHKWYKEAGKSEGSAQFSERIFNTFIGSGTLQLAPEQATIAKSFLDKQKVEQQLFQEQLERNRIQRAAQLEDFGANRADRIAAHQLRIDAARDANESAKGAKAEGELLNDESSRRLKKAQDDATAANAALEAFDKLVPPGDAAARAELQKQADEKKANLTRADTEAKAAKSRLDAATEQERIALTAFTAALNTPLPSADGLSVVTEQKAAPTLVPAKDFNFASIITPGTSMTVMTEQDKSLFPVGSSDISDLGNGLLPKTLGEPLQGKSAEAAFPARARLIDAAGNQTIARIFDFLGNPAAALEFKDKPIVMATGTIAVNPGWRTWQDYDGQIDVSAKYHWTAARRVTCQRIEEAKGLFNPEERAVAAYFRKHGRWPSNNGFTAFTGDHTCLKNSSNGPLAVAVSPLMERQNIDQASSQSRQDEIALYLSASLARSGQKAAGEVFDKYVRMRRLDVKTRSALPVVNSYGLGGNRFGFSVTSRIRAIGNVNKPKAAKVLEKQNFPILVAFGLSSDDLRPRLVKNTETREAQIVEPQIVLIQMQRWSRQKKRGDLHQGLRSVFLPGYPGRPGESPSDAYERFAKADYWWERLNCFLEEQPGYGRSETVKDFMKTAALDYGVLTEAGMGSQTILDIPVEHLVAPPPPTENILEPFIVSVFPSNVAYMKVSKQFVSNDRMETVEGYSATVTLMGANLDLLAYARPSTQPQSYYAIGTPLGALPKQGVNVEVFFKGDTPPKAFQISLALTGRPGEALHAPLVTTAALPR
jgi:hypothetical protein